MNPTRIYASLDEFTRREDLSVNGVSPEFAARHPDWAEQNATNTGCWNCVGCTRCAHCTDCIRCTRCANCVRCIRRAHCSDCTCCTCCARCVHCVHCAHCIDRARCYDCAGRAEVPPEVAPEA